MKKFTSCISLIISSCLLNGCLHNTNDPAVALFQVAEVLAYKTLITDPQQKKKIKPNKSPYESCNNLTDKKQAICESNVEKLSLSFSTAKTEDKNNVN